MCSLWRKLSFSIAFLITAYPPVSLMDFVLKENNKVNRTVIDLHSNSICNIRKGVKGWSKLLQVYKKKTGWIYTCNWYELQHHSSLPDFWLKIRLDWTNGGRRRTIQNHRHLQTIQSFTGKVFQYYASTDCTILSHHNQEMEWITSIIKLEL